MPLSYVHFMNTKMFLIGLLVNLAVVTVSAASTTESLILLPSDDSVVRFTNESLIVQCSSASGGKIHWKSPKGEIITDHRGRVHIEESNSETVKIVFTHISLADKGDWICEDVDGGKDSKSFNLIVYQKITFTENATILTVKEGKDAIILCEVKGEPEPNVTWSFNGLPISNETNIEKYVVLGDGLFIKHVTQNDTGEYTCRAYQVNNIVSDMQERTVLMKIEHKPHWSDTREHHPIQFAYINGTAQIVCEAISEPPANFTWHRKKQRLHNDKHYSIHTTATSRSTLTVRVRDGSVVFDKYKCRAQNSQGMVEREIRLERGEKPPPPVVLELRGFNSNTFDVNLGAVRTPAQKLSPMVITGYRIEYMTDYEFKSAAGNWSLAQRKDFRFEDGATFLIGNLEANTTYLMRAASINVAGFSDWTKVERFTTGFINTSSSAGLQHLNALSILCLAFGVLIWSRNNFAGAGSSGAGVGFVEQFHPMNGLIRKSSFM